MKEKITINAITKIGALFAFLAIAFSIAYYFVYFLPHKERIKLEQHEEQYEACLQKCDAKYPNKTSFEAFKEGTDVLYQTCNFECREKYAKPVIIPNIEIPGI